MIINDKRALAYTVIVDEIRPIPNQKSLGRRMVENC